MNPHIFAIISSHDHSVITGTVTVWGESRKAAMKRLKDDEAMRGTHFHPLEGKLAIIPVGEAVADTSVILTA